MYHVTWDSCFSLFANDTLANIRYAVFVLYVCTLVRYTSQQVTYNLLWQSNFFINHLPIAMKYVHNKRINYVIFLYECRVPRWWHLKQFISVSGENYVILLNLNLQRQRILRMYNEAGLQYISFILLLIMRSWIELT